MNQIHPLTELPTMTRVRKRSRFFQAKKRKSAKWGWSIKRTILLIRPFVVESVDVDCENVSSIIILFVYYLRSATKDDDIFWHVFCNTIHVVDLLQLHVVYSGGSFPLFPTWGSLLDTGILPVCIIVLSTIPIDVDHQSQRAIMSSIIAHIVLNIASALSHDVYVW